MNRDSIASCEAAGPLTYSSSSSYWNASKTADAIDAQLESPHSRLSAYASTASQVSCVLREWGRGWASNPAMSSFFRSPNALLHETEESIVALDCFRQWTLKQQWPLRKSLVIVDVCCGKGYFSMFLAHLATTFWAEQDAGTNRPLISKIILLDKSSTSDINWQHIDIANNEAGSKRPKLLLWPSTNLHDYDDLVDKFVGQVQSPTTLLAMIGIHLCKELTLSFCSLANGMGQKLAYASVAPCCLPRRVTKRLGGNKNLTVFRHESTKDRQRRIDYTALRRLSRCCFLCNAKDHLVRQCPSFPSDANEQSRILQQAILQTPCWTCSVVGHFASDCPMPSATRPSATPPSFHVNTDSVMLQDDPFTAYCRIIAAECLEIGQGQVVESGLTRNTPAGAAEEQKHWNASRKSVFIVATRDEPA